MGVSLRVAITGAAGMLGTAVLDHLSGEHVVFATSRELGYCKEGVHWQPFDLLDKTRLVGWLTEIRPDAVIHCAAMVNVDACEKDPAQAKALHAETTEVMVDTLSSWGGRLIYISTDSVFNGCKSGLYNENDEPDPPNIYARTKREGEVATLAMPGGTVLRTEIFGWSRSERLSFAEWVLKSLVEQTHLTMFIDVSYTPIHVSHVAEVVARTLDAEISGLYHATGSSVLSKYDFALHMAAAFGLSTDNVVPITIESAGLSAKRPKNMALSNRKLCDVLSYQLPTVDAGIAVLKSQYDNGWLARIKGRGMKPGYRFWETP